VPKGGSLWSKKEKVMSMKKGTIEKIERGEARLDSGPCFKVPENAGWKIGGIVEYDVRNGMSKVVRYRGVPVDMSTMNGVVQ
jgi:hypothetical protein